MAQEDREGTHRYPETPATRAGAGRPTRGDLRRRDRRRRRRRAVEGLTVLVCLVGLVAYLGRGFGGSAPEPEQAGVPGGAAGAQWPAAPRPSGTTLPAVASPGLNPREARPSPTPSPTPIPSGTPIPASARLLELARVEVPATVDLTGEGTLDWVHWGLRGARGTVRKQGGSGAVRDTGGRGTRAGHDTNPEVYAWRDGVEVPRETGTPTGVHTCGIGTGFSLAVAGDGEVRTLRLYLGVWMARGRLEARLPDGGPTATLRLEDPHTEHTAGFDLRFRARPGVRLAVNWVTERTFTPECGSVSLQAATLR